MSNDNAFERICNILGGQNAIALRAVKRHASQLLDCNHRFKFFTLHGEAHLESLFEILEIFLRAGVELIPEDLFALSLAICTHDLGMVVPLSSHSQGELLMDRPQSTDPAVIEEFIRNTHHDLVNIYYERDFNFLTSLQITPQTVGLAREISRCHRVVPLLQRTGRIQGLGALLRVIDELDISPTRAPYTVFETQVDDMDALSCWHWYKHNIVEPWAEDSTWHTNKGRHGNTLRFVLQVHPASRYTVNYWLNQTRRPIHKALDDENAASIIRDQYNVTVSIEADQAGSFVNNFGARWQSIETKALTNNRRILMVIDDEHRKLEDLFYPLMEDYYVVMSHNAHDAQEKMKALPPHLAIVDMQIPNGGAYTLQQSNDNKSTGMLICQHIRENYPSARIIVLTGTRFVMPEIDPSPFDLLLRKPIHPTQLKRSVEKVLPQ